MWSLGWLGTALLLGGLVAVIVTMAVAGLLPAVGLLLALAVVFGLMLWPDKHHRNGLQRIAHRAAHWGGDVTGANLYRSGPLATFGTHRLPGLLAASTLTEWEYAPGRRFALLHVPSSGDYSVTFTCSPDGAALVDQAQVNAWVAEWGGVLASYADEPGLIAAQVVIETTPGTGSRVRRHVERRADPDAPEVARAMLEEVVARGGQGSAQARTWVSLTFSGRDLDGKGRKAAAVAADLATRLPDLAGALAGTGAGTARPVTAQELCEVVLCAYDPSMRELLEDARDAGESTDLSWTEVGPAGHHAQWDRYRHGPAWSVTYGMSNPPHGEVFSTVLARLLAPHPDVTTKRVAICYRPIETGRAALVAEADKRSAKFRVASARVPSARAEGQLIATTRNAEHEARGAGLLNFAIMTTATVGGEQQLPAAGQAMKNLHSSARLTMRVQEGGQASAFAATLPLGLVLSRHLAVPAELRAAL